ncbi:hypothetical protein FTO60_08315 [Octadecabacter sp. SW4]|uniref:hypothetical protein n=1 Tax=Octadecabacter sp. SW4 TaxID=2602067 RepID=UPI0011C1F95D|nr:hypothetical protein [Octadecabacter sp. SW4]QEE35712.1 hypothetical protein FTO60_08315 [Octadecabacter sp. SW4]
MKTNVLTAFAAVLVVTSSLPAFAETRTAPGEWQPDNAAVLEERYGCDPTEWIRVISGINGETLYVNNWTCQPGRVTDRGSTPSIEEEFSETPLESTG